MIARWFDVFWYNVGLPFGIGFAGLLLSALIIGFGTREHDECGPAIDPKDYE